MLKHDFHMVLDLKTKTKLNQIFNNYTQSFSKQVNTIIELLYPYLEKYHYFAEEKNSYYQFVSTAGNIVDLHVYFDKKIYRRIKQLHMDLNYFSMGQIIRYMIKIFIKFVDKYGLSKAIKVIKNVNRKIKMTLKGIINKKSRHMSSRTFYRISYNEAFSPIIFNILYDIQ